MKSDWFKSKLQHRSGAMALLMALTLPREGSCGNGSMSSPARRNFRQAQELALVWLTGCWDTAPAPRPGQPPCPPSSAAPDAQLQFRALRVPGPVGSADTGHSAHLRHDLLSLLIALHSQLAPERSRLFDWRIPTFGKTWLLLLLSNSGAWHLHCLADCAPILKI